MPSLCCHYMVIFPALHRCIPRRSSNAGSCLGWSCNPHPPSLPCTPAVKKKNGRHFDARIFLKPKKSEILMNTKKETMGIMMHTCNNCKEHTVWVRIGLANVVHRHHPNFYGFAAPETVAQVMLGQFDPKECDKPNNNKQPLKYC